MGQLIILMGPTGAGKSYQGQFLATHGWQHISSGELLRHDLKEAAVLARGELAPSAEVERLVEAAVTAVPAGQPVVLDGFPRTLDEAAWLDERASSWGRTLEAVMLLEVSEAVAAARLASRGRSDDTPEALAEKVREYREITAPLVSAYEARGVLHRLNGDQSVEEVGKLILEVLEP